MKEKVLVVEDNVEISNAIKVYLSNIGYQVFAYPDGFLALEACDEMTFDIGIVDVMLPEMSGYAFIKKVRLKTKMPIIILSALENEYDKVKGFNAGADDYMVKPFSPIELIARVQSSLRRWQMLLSKEVSQEISISNLRFDLKAIRVFKDDEEIFLTATELKILRLLMEHPNQIFSKKRICEHVNGEYFESDEKSLVVHISKLREKIGVSPEGKKYIKTIRGLGYKIEEK